MGDTYTASANLGHNLIRLICSTLDRPAYWLLEMVYQLFFNVSSADIFAGGMITKFYGRIQVILSVFMMFHLAITILRGIMNPDSFFDKKSGVGNFVYRIIVSLVLLTLMVPIKTGRSNEFEKQLNNNGLLFGTLYSLQHRVLANNTIGRLVMGSLDNDYVSNSGDSDNLKAAARIFTSTVLRGFYRINLLPEDQRPKHEEGKDDAVFNANRICQNIDDKVLDAYIKVDADPGDIIDMVNETCEPSFSIPVLSSFNGSKKYVFTYMPVIPTIVGFVFAFIMLSFTVDVAIRIVKLAVLRLIAPIPIIAYMNPKGTQDNSFNSWVKTLTSTYLDLFIRLASVYFVIALIQEMISTGIYINRGDGLIGILSLILIWLGLFIFAKQAPKFIKEVLGLKQDVGGVFGGFGELAGIVSTGAGFAAAIGGGIGSGLASARASKMADETRNALEMNSIFGNRVNPNAPHNKAKHLAAGILGGFAGAATGVQAVKKAKEHQFSSALEALQKRNAANLTRGNEGSTFLGRIRSSLQQFGTGDGSAAKLEREISGMQSRQKAMDEIAKRVSGEMVKQDWTFGNASGISGTHGVINGKINYKDFISRYRAASASGATDFEINYKDAHGNMQTDIVTTQQAEYYQGLILAANEDDYIKQVTTVGSGHEDAELKSLIEDAKMKGGSGYDPATGNFNVKENRPIDSRKAYKQTSESLGQLIREANRQNAVNKANDRYSSKK